MIGSPFGNETKGSTVKTSLETGVSFDKTSLDVGKTGLFGNNETTFQ